MGSAHDDHTSVPLGLLAAMRAGVMGLMLAAILVPGATLASKATSTSSHDGSGPTSVKTAKTKIKRSAKAKDNFKHLHPCPSTGKSSGPCPGYVIDHIKPLCAGGIDAPSNMQWQTLGASKAKDKLERRECSAFPK